MPDDLDTKYNQEQEPEIYKAWEDSGFFNPDIAIKKGVTKKTAKPFSMALPPPNVTGRLHMGHAAMLAIQDILARYHRMKGDKTLWLPGTDHSPIATQARVESDIYKKEGKSRYDLGREALIARIEQFAKESHDTIVSQLKAMGSSLDWSREAYTADEARSLAVRTTFESMYNDGIIYRGARLVNWDPKMQTTISDDEIEWIDEKTSFYYLKYGPFTIATARPETKFGDKYVVMHPKDKRYAKWKDGEKIELEWINGPITATIIKDAAIDMKFGTGVMTITPWHDATDFEIANRHKLDKEQIIDMNGKLLPIAGEFAGQHIKKARPLIVEKLRTKGLVEKIDENYTHRVATNSRGGGMIEPQIKEQWFIDVNKKFKLRKPIAGPALKGLKPGTMVSLKELMHQAVKSGQIGVIPKRFEKTYHHWINNLRDWCISRQIWFGHQIPVWYKQDETYCGINPPDSEGWQQDPDTLDTWFSSGLWTFSTLGWPKTTPDLKTYHPTTVLETGYDILFFWVARMILMTGYNLGTIPFHTVYMHGLVRDGQGRKMSKSLGNIIDPLDMITKYGADATRLSLVIGAGPGNDIKLSEDRVRGYRNFSTKIWNASRFVVMNVPKSALGGKPKYSAQEKAMLKKLADIKKVAEHHIEKFELHLAAEKLYHFFWHFYADKVIEYAKPKLAGKKTAEKESAQALLVEFQTTLLKLLHPFMPFVTEAAWQKLIEAELVKPLKSEQKLLMVQRW